VVGVTGTCAEGGSRGSGVFPWRVWGDAEWVDVVLPSSCRAWVPVEFCELAVYESEERGTPLGHAPCESALAGCCLARCLSTRCVAVEVLMVVSSGFQWIQVLRRALSPFLYVWRPWR
jgi:hypothetical protein